MLVKVWVVLQTHVSLVPMVLAVEVGTFPTVVEQLVPEVTVAADVLLCRDTG